jgi:hypothetical protein
MRRWRLPAANIWVVGNKCMGNDDTCGANRMKGQELCVGHYRQAVNLAELAEQIESEE